MKPKLIHGMLCLAMLLNCSCHPEGEAPLLAKVKINDSLYSAPVSGKLIFLFSPDTSAYLVYWVNPFDPHPVFTYDLENWDPKDTIYIKEFTDSWHKDFAELRGQHAYRALLDVNTEERSSFAVRGNGYSKRSIEDMDSIAAGELLFEINGSFRGWEFKETEYIKEYRVKSESLSNFWGKDMFIESAIVYPKDYAPEYVDYPIVYVLPGFGSHHASICYGSGQIDRYGMNTIGKPKIFVFMNAEFVHGYHHFADSENNGPWGQALTEEFIPQVEEMLDIDPKNTKRYLMGQSSGAWTALWLQVSYPDLFEKAFAASPDPIDFRAHGHNIYTSRANFYYPSDADSAAIAQGNLIKGEAMLEDVLGEYGQIKTWEASFSPKTEAGTMAALFDRETGAVDPEVAQHWSQYDISKLISDNPDAYRNALSGKIHLFVSHDDPYGLAKSVVLFDTVMKQNQIAADIRYYDGKGHNVWDEDLRKYIHGVLDGGGIK